MTVYCACEFVRARVCVCYQHVWMIQNLPRSNTCCTRACLCATAAAAASSSLTCRGCGGVPIESLILYVTRLSELTESNLVDCFTLVRDLRHGELRGANAAMRPDLIHLLVRQLSQQLHLAERNRGFQRRGFVVVTRLHAQLILGVAECQAQPSCH